MTDLSVVLVARLGVVVTSNKNGMTVSFLTCVRCTCANSLGRASACQRAW